MWRRRSIEFEGLKITFLAHEPKNKYNAQPATASSGDVGADKHPATFFCVVWELRNKTSAPAVELPFLTLYISFSYSF